MGRDKKSDFKKQFIFHIHFFHYELFQVHESTETNAGNTSIPNCPVLIHSNVYA